jgi:transposase InsO family protein
MHARVMAAAVAVARSQDDGHRVNVTALAKSLGVAPKTLYKWANRYRDVGLAGLEEESRRPKEPPVKFDDDVLDAVVRLRKQLRDDGWDYGAEPIREHLLRESGSAPSTSTIWRMLKARGFVMSEPAKRPKASFVRFEADAPNERWQIDATHWQLADGTAVEIINIIDDHSRLCVAAVAVPTTTSEAAWAAFNLGVDRYGWPAGCLSDNGLAFSGRLKGFEVVFEIRLRAAGVQPVTSRPRHPQTCGKVERFQQTEKKWLRAQDPANDLDELQANLETFRDYYNRVRPHRGITRRTPWDRWTATTRAIAAPTQLPPPQHRATNLVNPNGTITCGTWTIGIGTRHAGKHADLVIDGLFAAVFIDGQLHHTLTIDPARRHQPRPRT